MFVLPNTYMNSTYHSVQSKFPMTHWTMQHSSLAIVFFSSNPTFPIRRQSFCPFPSLCLHHHLSLSSTPITFMAVPSARIMMSPEPLSSSDALGVWGASSSLLRDPFNCHILLCSPTAPNTISLNNLVFCGERCPKVLSSYIRISAGWGWWEKR